MIDIHCHILPGLDDGPATLDEAVAMCRMAAADGITTTVATPHFRPGRFGASSAQVREGIAGLASELQRQGIVLELLPGADVAVFPELAACLDAEPHLSLNNGRYFLAELPHDGVLPRWDAFLLSLLRTGRVPVLTHPERNAWFIHHPETLYAFVVKGGMVQITAGSLTGLWGDRVREFSMLLLRHNLVHSIASDAHDMKLRKPELSEAVRQAAGIIGGDHARALVTTAPRAIIEGRSVSLPGPVPLSAAPGKRTWVERLFSTRKDVRTGADRS